VHYFSGPNNSAAFEKNCKNPSNIRSEWLPAAKFAISKMNWLPNEEEQFNILDSKNEIEE
jgi:hypothetical protein